MKLVSASLGVLVIATLSACSTTSDNAASQKSSMAATSTSVAAKPAAAKKSGDKITMHKVSASGMGESIGTVSAKDTPNGLELTAKMKGLTPGLHGFHLHDNPSCDPKEQDGKMGAAMAAGGHFDPAKTGKHEGPMGEGHTGDLLPLLADEKGDVDVNMTIPRLTVAQIKNHALIVHEGGDTFSDEPTLGGGGARIACGVVE